MDKIVLFENKKECCACGACLNACPRNAVSMQEDEFGFLYPNIDGDKCIECGACQRACAYQGNMDRYKTPKIAYAAFSTLEISAFSASGGVLYNSL